VDAANAAQNVQVDTTYRKDHVQIAWNAIFWYHNLYN